MRRTLQQSLIRDAIDLMHRAPAADSPLQNCSEPPQSMLALGTDSTSLADFTPDDSPHAKEFLMRSRTFFLSVLIGFCVTTAALMILSLFSGCTAAQLNTADRALGGTPLTAVAVASPPTATTQPAATATTQPTNLQLTVHLLQDAVSAAQPIVAAAPAPVSSIGGIALMIAGGILGLFGVKQAAAAATATASANTSQTALSEIEDLIGAAGPSLKTAIQTLISNPTVQADLGSLLALASHPAAVATAGPVTNATLKPTAT